jgi:hypothetical protein
LIRLIDKQHTIGSCRLEFLSFPVAEMRTTGIVPRCK